MGEGHNWRPLAISPAQRTRAAFGASPAMNTPTPSLSKLKAVSKSVMKGTLDKVPWFEREPEAGVEAASDEELLEGVADPEKMSRDQLFVRYACEHATHRVRRPS